MADRLTLIRFGDAPGLEQHLLAELETLSGRGAEFWSRKHAPLRSCCALAIRLGAVAAVVQRRVQDPDFLAEYNAYYSRQFSDVTRHCARVHLFAAAPKDGQSVLQYLDGHDTAASYLGFVTLRPVAATPVGASILRIPADVGFIRCADEFPVNLAGHKLELTGVPFMQQDNAVGTCAQASIWMALRTMRKREGDRAHDPAQITGAATRYSISGRILPNRKGLTQPQVVEAIRAAGYSPHPIHFALGGDFTLGSRLDANQLSNARRVLHAYVESGIPVLLILYPGSGGHAVVIIGHTFSPKPAHKDELAFSLQAGAVQITHTVSWVPEFVIHNDNSGPYLPLPQETNGSGYALDQTYAAVPLLPADVFVSGEEALQFATTLWQDILEELTASMNYQQAVDLCNQFAVRLLLLEKRKIRAWAANSAVAPEVREHLRLADLPRRVWVLELHLKDCYGAHANEKASSLVGFILLDSTGDAASTAMLFIYLNFPAFSDTENGSLIIATADEWKAVQIEATPPVVPFRDL